MIIDIFRPPPKLYAYDDAIDIEDGATSWRPDDSHPPLSSGISTLELATTTSAAANTVNSSASGSCYNFSNLQQEEDQEMSDIMPPTTISSSEFNCAGSQFTHSLGKARHESGSYGGSGCGEHDGGDGDNLVRNVQGNSDLSNSPKLYVLEDLRGVLSRKPNTDFVMERVLREESSKPKLAMVLWKPPPSCQSPIDDEGITEISCDNLFATLDKKVEEDDEGGGDEMEVVPPSQ